jgi:hypothetical protein
MADQPTPLSSASALSPEERLKREAFEKEARERAEAELRRQAERDLETWRGVAEQVLAMVESDLKHEQRVRSARLTELMARVAEALTGSSPAALRSSVAELSDEVWGPGPEPDGPMSPAVAMRRRRR